MRPWAVVFLLPLTACGSSSVTSSSHGGVGEQLEELHDTDPAPVVTITASGVTPSVSHLEHDVPVTFVNQDTVPHTYADAPDLGYGECPEVRVLGTLAPGEQKAITVDRVGALCTFRDVAHTGGPPLAGLLVIH